MKTARGNLKRRWPACAALAGIFLLWVAGCGRPAEKTAVEGPEELMLPEQGAYTGAYIDFGDTEDEVTLEALESFEKMVGKKQAIIASSSWWGEQSFPARNVRIISAYGAEPLVYWSPWDKPYRENKSPDRFNLPSIAEGKWDAYIDRWADEAKAYGRPLLVAWGLEMNGTWFPWSGYFYGKGKTTAEGPAGPVLYKKAYRHVVDRVRARGARNIRWVFHCQDYSDPQESWNTMEAYYPGSAYVDWLGLSVYGQQFRHEKWTYFHDVMDYPYREICAVDPAKPVMLAEWGVGEFPTSGSKEAWIREGFEQMRNKYPRLKTAVFWHERWQNADDSYSNLRVNSSPEALRAYREGVADPFWIGRPLFRPSPRGSAEAR